jgi:hypothetical protein
MGSSPIKRGQRGGRIATDSSIVAKTPAAPAVGRTMLCGCVERGRRISSDLLWLVEMRLEHSAASSLKGER